MFDLRFASLTVLVTAAAACTNGAAASVSSSTTDTSSALTTSALSSNSNTTALAAGQRVDVTFSPTDSNTVVQVVIADPNDHGGGNGPASLMGPPHGNPAGGPGGNPNDANRMAPPNPTVAGALHGAITAVDLSAGSLTVLGVTVLTDVNTHYMGISDLSAAQVGLLVDIQGQTGTDGSFSAAQVGVRPGDLSGIISAVSSDTPPVITVLGRAIALSANTQVLQLTEPPQGGGQDPNGGRGPSGGQGPGDQGTGGQNPPR